MKLRWTQMTKAIVIYQVVARAAVESPSGRCCCWQICWLLQLNANVERSLRRLLIQLLVSAPLLSFSIMHKRRLPGLMWSPIFPVNSIFVYSNRTLQGKSRATKRPDSINMFTKLINEVFTSMFVCLFSAVTTAHMLHEHPPQTISSVPSLFKNSAKNFCTSTWRSTLISRQHNSSFVNEWQERWNAGLRTPKT